jgi:hypothetical protein
MPWRPWSNTGKPVDPNPQWQQVYQQQLDQFQQQLTAL